MNFRRFHNAPSKYYWTCSQKNNARGGIVDVSIVRQSWRYAVLLCYGLMVEMRWRKRRRGKKQEGRKHENTLENGERAAAAHAFMWKNFFLFLWPSCLEENKNIFSLSLYILLIVDGYYIMLSCIHNRRQGSIRKERSEGRWYIFKLLKNIIMTEPFGTDGGSGTICCVVGSAVVNGYDIQ